MIQEIFSTLFQVIVPLSIPVISGVLMSRFFQLDTKPLLTLVLYYLSPALIFDTLAHAEVSHQDIYLTLLFSLANLFLLWAIAVVIGKTLKFSSNDIAGLTLISSFTNSVNYGIPLVILAFGQLGLDKASVYVVLQMIIVNTVGVYFAARSNFTVRDAIKSVFKLPAIYSAMLALMFNYLHISMPSGIGSGIAMIAQAYSPVVLVVLGVQMTKVKTERLVEKTNKAYWAGMGIRLLIAPIIALLCLNVLHIEGMLYSVLLVLACMPVAVNAGILAEKFDASPKIVTKSIMWTTVISFFLLPFIIVLVK